MPSSLRWLWMMVLSVAPAAQAYPQYLARGTAQCASCHVSPTGGGFIGAMGQSSVEALIPDLLAWDGLKQLRAKVAKTDPQGADAEGPLQLEWLLGVDTRVLFVPSSPDVGVAPAWQPIPMLFEVGGVVAMGPWSVYLSGTPRRVSAPANRLLFTSREHWLSVAVDELNTLRVGRLVLPFGLRGPDHTLYTREDFGFGKYEQSYAVQWDRVTDAVGLHLAAFAGDLLWTPVELQERGLAFTFTWTGGEERLSVGASLLAAAARHYLRPAASVFFRWRPVGATYLMGELDAQRKQALDVRAGSVSAAGHLRAGWFPHESTELFAEVAGRAFEGHFELTKLRYQFGLNAHLLPWVEVAPALVLEEDVETGLKTTVLAQLHVFY